MISGSAAMRPILQRRWAGCETREESPFGGPLSRLSDAAIKPWQKCSIHALVEVDTIATMSPASILQPRQHVAST
ncbi:MAG TPA: hypothetical protein VMD30_06970, partial [Tepidisphaeraceae bacterium]|nr:hypothetical protein [Tepidisphaeraceae bacterium]